MKQYGREIYLGEHPKPAIGDQLKSGQRER
jgi:hypothetical protein